MLAFSLASVSCGTSRNFLGRDITVDEFPYSFRGRELAFMVGSPTPEPAPWLPLVVFLEGDGTLCQGYKAGLWRRFLLRFTGDYLMVRPRTYVNSICGGLLFPGAEFKRADFAHRLEELEILLAVLRKEFSRRPVYLLGHSAGADLAILYASLHPAEIRGLINLGGGLRPLSELLPEIEHARAKRKSLPEQELVRRLDRVHHIIERVARHAGSDDPLWGRTWRFWHQLFFTGTRELWRSYDGSILVAQGMKDWHSTPAHTVLADRDELEQTGQHNIEFRFYADLGHNLMKPQVFRDVDMWLRRQTATSPVW